MKRLRWQILVVFVTLVVVAVLLVGQQPLGNLPLLPQPTSGGVYTEALVGSMGRLNPLLDWNNSSDRDIDSLIYSGLIRFDSHGLPQPDLAESWGTSADGTIYNFTLRPNAVWQDGEPMEREEADPALEALRRNIPALRGLPLLKLLANLGRGSGGGSAVLDYLPPLGLQVEVLPC